MANTKLINCDQLQISLTRVKSYIDGGFSVNTHNHNTDYYTKNQIDDKVNTINAAISGKANSSHSHGGADVVLTGYTKPNATGAIANTDNLNAAIGKIEKALDGKSSTSHNHDASYLGINATAKAANKLATARTINGVSFDGTANITITANPNAHTHTNLVTKTVSNSTLTLGTELYQYAAISSNTTIKLPSTSSFTEIHLFFNWPANVSVTMPSGVKWQQGVMYGPGHVHEFVFTYVKNIGWLGGCVVYG